MKFKGGPWDGHDNGVSMDPLQVGTTMDAPMRMQIEGRWLSVSHLYEIDGPEEATYVVSQFIVET